jgi:hypothetical protein
MWLAAFSSSSVSKNTMSSAPPARMQPRPPERRRKRPMSAMPWRVPGVRRSRKSP